MPESEIPIAILRKHPELAAVGKALEQRRHGEPITAVCATCGEVLQVTEIVETKTTVVSCPNGHTSYRAKHA
jgi:hypothetical protein